MSKVLLAFCLHFSWQCLSLSILTSTTFATTLTAIPGCPTKCGNVIVPYPFGLGLDGKCSLSKHYDIFCNTSFHPPKPFLGTSKIEVLDININGQMLIKNTVAFEYYQGGKESINSTDTVSFNLSTFPLTFSDTENKLTVIGCDDVAEIDAVDSRGRQFAGACAAVCFSPEGVDNGSCSGAGCCQISIPKGIKSYTISLSSLNDHINVSDFNRYGYAFLGKQDLFTFNVADLNDSTFKSRTQDNVPVMLEWVVGVNQTCAQAKRNLPTYACKNNTNCTDFDSAFRGYRCSCLPGYEGNPYLSPGCTDINECEGPKTPCSHTCTNTPGEYKCSCPKGHQGDGLKSGTGCISTHLQFVAKLSIGVSLGFVSMLMIMGGVCFTLIRRKQLIKLREELFEQNGGILLKQQLSQNGGTMKLFKIFSVDELKAATNNYSEDRILGKGGYGVVYKGILKDGCVIAIKKARVAADRTQIEQFINEVVILTQINHRNVVKLLGCCLEAEVPLLVYEFISNGTLFEHIHGNKGITSWLTWENCIRLASEAADALMYLHSAAAIPIIHRDVKSANILLDESYTAKIADFGASRLIPIDQTQVTTLVQGTLGYLDPEYFQTSKLTEKSDVYSFGVLLAELLTREKPLLLARKTEEKNLAMYFLLSMKEGRLMDILDSQLVREASEEQLVTMSNLVVKCLNVKGEDRPTMREVFLVLEGLKKQNRHPWAEQNNETTNLVSRQDLSPNDDNGDSSTMECSRHYSIEMSLMNEMNSPR